MITPKDAVRGITVFSGQVLEQDSRGRVTMFAISQNDLKGIPSWIVGEFESPVVPTR